jgi:hypothetical protein
VNLYRSLRSINPSPYMFYFDFGDCQLVGASPEILVRREGDKVTLRPIAGTRKRGATPERDLEMERELVADPEGARRAPDADRPGPQRRRAASRRRQREGHRDDGGRALLARDAHGLERRGRRSIPRSRRWSCCARPSPRAP